MTSTKTFIQDKASRVVTQLPYIPRALGLVWSAARPWAVAWSGLLVLQGVLPVATVYLTKALVDGIVAVVGGAGEVGTAVLLAALMAVVLLFAEILRGVNGWVRTAQSELVQDHIQSLIHEKSTAVDLAFYDSAEFYDHLHRARADASFRPIAMLESLGGLFQHSITLVAMGVVLLRFGVWLPVALLLSTAPALAVILRYTVREHEWRRRVTSEERRGWYYDWLLTSRETAAELRLFQLGAHFQAAYQSLRNRIRTERVELARQRGLAELGAGTLGLAVMGGATIWMVWRALQGEVTLGDLALFYQAFHQGLRLMRSLLENASQLYANMLFLGNLFEFLSLEPQLPRPATPKPAPQTLSEGIQCHAVSFRYPDSDRFAVHKLNLNIPAGKITAVVGANGAGKSTLVRLLCRFYDPEAGRIEMDGVDIRDLQIEELRSRITVLFQEPVHYNATAAENILAGDLNTTERTLRAAAEAAKADEVIHRLPLGYDSLLGRLFVDGTDLSVGEWQRLAMARAYVRNAPLIVLDEPTSAMDPWSELEWMKHLRLVAAGRTVLIITHRLTTARFADHIHIMENGRVVESGSHEELRDRGERYGNAWKSHGSG